MNELSPQALAHAASIEELHALLAQARVGPGWNKPTPSLWPEPKQRFIPAHWSYAQMARPALDAAGRHVSTELAERRNLILANPIPGNDYATVPTLISAYQMVRAHETARSHRHSANALRFVLDARPKAYTIVNGKKIPMRPGDVLLTPNWAWHGHSNESDADAYWIDFLDVPLVHLLGPMFMECYEEFLEPAGEVDEASPFRFSWSVTQARLDAAPTQLDGRHSVELGPPHLDTIGLTVHRLEAGRQWSRPRSTASVIVAVMDGAGHSEIAGRRFDWQRGDVLAVPAWLPATHHANQRSHLLAVSDEPLMRRLNWQRDAC